MDITYSLKVSPQGQLTLPKSLRERLAVRSGARVIVVASANGELQLSTKPPVTKHFGSLPNLWTKPGQDAAEYARQLRDSMQPSRGGKQ